MSEDIVLKDWSSHVTGRAEVIKIMENLFALATRLKVTPISFFSNSDHSYAIHITILIDDKPLINVIDIINFDTNGKISEVIAFKYENID
jgi:hypothetical protein